MDNLNTFDLCFEDWGLIDYKSSVDKQKQYIENIFLSQHPDTIVFCSHPSLVSLGRAFKKEDLVSWKGDIFESSRGGRATYHGPSQIVIYPLINLNLQRKHLKAKDIYAYLRLLEKILIKSLKDLGFDNFTGKLSVEKNTDDLEKTGLWKNNLKVASIGIAIKKWISYHGIAINLTKDEQAFKGIKACGYDNNIMTSLEELENTLINKKDLQKSLSKNFNYFLKY